MLSILLLASCSNGVGPDTVDTYEGTGTIRILSISPGGPYTTGNSYDFTVEVAYTLEGASQAEIVLGFGGQAGSTSWNYIDENEIVGPTSDEITKTYTISNKILMDLSPDEEEIFDASLAPYPREDTYSPLYSDIRVITVE